MKILDFKCNSLINNILSRIEIGSLDDFRNELIQIGINSCDS